MKRALVLLALSACATVQKVPDEPAKPEVKVEAPATCAKEAPMGAEGAAPLGSKIEKVCLFGASENAWLRLHEVVVPREGSPLDANAIRADLKALFAQGMVRDARAIVTPLGEMRVVLSWVVTEFPFVSKVKIEGSKTFTGEQLAELAPSGKRASGLELARIRAALTEYFVERGFPKVDVTTETKPVEGGTSEVVVQISEGMRVTVKAIRFAGLKQVKEAELRKVLRTTTGTPFQQTAADIDAIALSTVYFDHGMVNVSIEPSVIEKGEGALEVLFTVKEGPQYKLGKLSFAGFSLGVEQELLKAFESKPGAVFSRAAIQRDIERIRDRAKKKGLVVDVTPNTNIDADAKKVDVSFELEKKSGPVQF